MSVDPMGRPRALHQYTVCLKESGIDPLPSLAALVELVLLSPKPRSIHLRPAAVYRYSLAIRNILMRH